MTRGSAWHPPHPGRRDRGQVTVALVGVIGALVVALGGALEVARAVALAHQARGGADLAALAGAAEAVLGGEPTRACARAGAVAAANGVHLVGCRVEADLSVWVEVECGSDRPWSRTARGSARAGPG